MLTSNHIPHIIFIDEQKSEHRKFQRLFMQEIATSEVIITPLLPSPTLDIMIEEIFSFHPDALVVDWNLNDIKNEGTAYNIGYTGSDLVKEFLSIRKSFPCFIATSLDEDASRAHSTFDVNMIYPKSSGLDEKSNSDQILTFKDKILLQIDKYRTLISEKETRFEMLINKKRNGENLKYDEEVEIRELDNFLESSIDNRGKTPDDLKEVTNTKKLNSLLENVNRVLERLNNAK